LWWSEEKIAGVSKWHQRFLFDPFGNRRLLNDPGTLIPNQMMTPRVGLVSDANPFNTANNQWTGAEYYPNGNQKTAWGNGTEVGSAKYFYDGENRMRQAEVNWPGSGTITAMEYGYDGEGRRVMRKVAGAVRTVWVYNAMGQMVAEYESSSVAAPSCGGPCYLTADHLGSTRVVWGGDGTIKQLRDYAPFGEEVVSTLRGDDARYPTALYPRSGTQSLPVEFTGKERDAESGLDFMEARYFSGAQGRFTSPDEPLAFADFTDPQSWNLYSYGLNSPLRYSDPTGHEPCENGVNPENGNFCTVTTAEKSKVDPKSSPIGPLIIPLLVTTAQLAQNTHELAQPVADWFSRPRNPNCTAAYTGLGASIGFWAGGGLGTLGLAGGPAAAATIPGGAAGGTALGGAIGGFGGLVLCSTSSGTGAGSGAVSQSSTKEFWKGLKSFRGKTKTNGLQGKDKRFFEWDHTHGDVEVYDRRGRHLGSADPNTGAMTKPAVPGRSITI